VWAPSIGEAVAVAIRLQREGQLVETIQADTGLKLTSRDVSWLCETNEFNSQPSVLEECRALKTAAE